MSATQQDPMEYIWERIPKTKDGLIHYLPGDIPYLYENGFVDTGRVTPQQWIQAFESYKQADGSYLLSKEKFLSLRVFRYEGPLFEPFDPYKVREGEWTDAQLKILYDQSIRPSTVVPEDVFWNSVAALKKQGLVKNGNLWADATTKKQLAYLVERFPSPRRRLEKEVNRLRKERESEYRQVTQKRDSSKFVEGKFASEKEAEKFKSLQSKTAKKQTNSKKTTTEASTVDIKKLRKPTRKITV
ncbi:MAG TPA: hypothetical protein DDW49_08555 [Deltaproteobacteria bacterium]|nr:MAG: hypothetical protein A2048_05515 [Deltaproteobacteria bacterium GWA2_45_12]HBF13415.1 hypothetical protein [Deltaproteobacteria bacterium]